MRTLSLRIALTILAIMLATSLRPASPASAIVHLAEIHEVMVGFDGDPDVQYVEINMRLGLQNITTGAKLSIFDATGTFIDADPGAAGDQPLLTIPGNVPNGGDGVRWLMGTPEFEVAFDIQVDFAYPPDPWLPGAGMVCLFENLRDFTNPVESIDCVAYGGAAFTCANPNSSPSEAADFGPGDGTKSLTRIVLATFNASPPWAQSDDANAFALRCATPENNAGEVGLIGADDDGDGVPNCHEADIGTDPDVADTDRDGCDDGDELGTIKNAGLDPTNIWDVFDTDTENGLGAGTAFAGSVTIGDVFAVAGHFGDSGSTSIDPLSDASGPDYHTRFDRTNVENLPHPPTTGPPDGSVAIGDVFLVAGQFGLNC